VQDDSYEILKESMAQEPSKNLTIRETVSYERIEKVEEKPVSYRIAYWKVLNLAPNSTPEDAQVFNYHRVPTLEVGLIPENADVKPHSSSNNEEHLFELPGGTRIIRLQPGDLWPNLVVPSKKLEALWYDGDEIEGV
jgi:hypothetical protein